MSAKILLVLCAQALFIQSAISACCGASGGYGGDLGYGAEGGYGFSANGGGFTVTSSSPISPVGLTVDSGNRIEGCLASNGKLPFITAVAVEGQLPAVGDAATSYGCGGCLGIRPVGGYGAGYGSGYGAGCGRRCGCGSGY